MAVYEKTVEVDGTLSDFIAEFYSKLQEISEITLTPSNYSGLDISSNFSITISCKNIDIVLAKAPKGFSVSVSNTDISGNDWEIMPSSYVDDHSANRKCSFKLVVSDNLVYFVLSNCWDYIAHQLILIPVKTNNIYTYFYHKHYERDGIDSINDGTFYKSNENTVPYKIPTLLPYTVLNGNVDKLDSVIVTNGNYQKVEVINGLKSCSTVPVRSVLTIDNKQYFSVCCDVIAEITEVRSNE